MDEYIESEYPFPDNEYDVIILNQQDSFQEHSDEDIDEWMTENDDSIYKSYQEIQQISRYTGLFDKLTYPVWCQFSEDCTQIPQRDEYNWNVDLDEFPVYEKKFNPTYKQWLSSNLNDLQTMFNYVKLIIYIDGFEHFSELAYTVSTSSRYLGRFGL